MSRMNGGTNFILALHEASKALKQDLRRRREEGFEGPAEHTVVMLTDGRIDAFQSREAVRQIEYMADELPGLRLFCYAVGRSVDRDELLQMIGPTTGGDAARARDFYMDLRTLDSNLW